MFHASLSLGFALPVAGRFGCAAQDRPVLYLNGEMSVDVLTNFLHANARGIGVDVADLPRGRLIFEGENGLSDIFVGLDDGTSARNLERLMERHRPALVVIDTFRALFEADENKTREVRTVLAWLRMLSEQFSCAIVVSHHLRKLSAISNGVRERVSGVRDLIAAVDIHVALLSPSGQPANRLRLDKTRLPFEGVTAGTEWPLEACWLDGKPPSSTFAAGGPTQQNVTPVETAEDEILAIIAAEGPKTIKQLDADGGSRKRALEVLRGKGSLVKVGKRDRAILLGFPGTGNEAEIIDLDSWRDRVR